MRNSDRAERWTPRHPRLAAAGFRLALPFAERFFRHKNFHRQNSQFAAERSKELAVDWRAAKPLSGRHQHWRLP